MAVQAIEAVRIKLSWVNANLHHEASRDGWSTPQKMAAHPSDLIPDPESMCSVS